MSDYDPSTEGPDKIGQYEVTGRIGRGSFGVVYKGRDPYLKRDVAIKICTVDDDNLRQRFYREAEIAGKLEHDHVVAVHAFGFEDDAPYLVQEFLEGRDLSHLIRKRVAWSGQRKLDILAQIAGALAYAHDQGVIHRDVKPANVRVLAVEPEVKVKLMDFGIAKLAHDESQLTQKGVTMGTASYLPPEQVKGGEVDHRGDIFAFGVLAYELLTMDRPFRGQTLSALVYQILYKAPKKLIDAWPGCPLELSQWVHKCLQKEPAGRFADFREVLEALAPIREGAAVGQWPALSEVWLPTESPEKDVESQSEEDALSQGDETEPSTAGRSTDGRSAGSVTQPTKLEESVGSRTQAVDSPEPERDFDATQPVTPRPANESGTDVDRGSGRGFEVDDAVATRRIPIPEAQAKDDSTGTEVPEELRTSAHEISKLVEAGDLEAAMAQLEETIHRHRGVAKTSDDSGVRPQSDREEIDAERPTVEIPRSASEEARATVLPPLPDLPAPAAIGADPELSRPTEAMQATAAGGAGRPARAGRGAKPILIGAFAVAAVLAVVIGWWLGRGRKEQPTVPVVETPPAPQLPATPPETGLVVQSTPWATVTEVSNADGFVVDLPPDAFTPLYLPLEPGQYTVIVRYADGNEEQRCEVQVTPEQSATCVTPFTQPTASDYFKDAGWWR